MKLFYNEFAYPRDSYGCFVELDGEIIFVKNEFVKVHTPKGDFSAVYDFKYENRFFAGLLLGDSVTVRVYRSGGGYYPDNRVVSWTSKHSGKHYREI